jgi:AraC-like DNA-binding protein
LQYGYLFEGTGVNTKLDHIKNWLELAREANWSAKALAKRCNVSVRTLERYFLRKKGKAPKAWLAEVRQQLAVELLQDGTSVKETAGCLKYKHPSHLTNEFKKHWGHCPTTKSVPARASNP